MKITIDEEFKSLIPPLSDEERMQLMDNLQREGCRDPLVVWKGTGILIDGHNRFEICERENIDYNVHEIGFESREKALDWIYRNQLGRRNLNPADASELRGRMYNGRKKKHGGERKASPQNDDLKTAEIVAKETGVSKATIERDGKYAEAIETAAKKDPQIRAKVRSGKVKKSEVIAKAKSKPTESKPVKSKPEQAGQSNRPAFDFEKAVGRVTAAIHRQLETWPNGTLRYGSKDVRLLTNEIVLAIDSYCSHGPDEQLSNEDAECLHLTLTDDCMHPPGRTCNRCSPSA